VADYVLTSESIVPIIERFGANPDAPEMYRDLPPAHFAPQAETMQRVVEEVRRSYGSFAEYLVAKGLHQAALDALAHELLERPEGLRPSDAG
jgi:hypothetical protein